MLFLATLSSAVLATLSCPALATGPRSTIDGAGPAPAARHGPEGPPGRPGSCPLRVEERTILKPSASTALYVEPRVVGALAGGGYMIAGSPAYAWALDRRGRGTLLPPSTVVGAWVRGGAVLPLRGDPRWHLIAGGDAGGGRWGFIRTEAQDGTVGAPATRGASFVEYDSDDGLWGAPEGLGSADGFRLVPALSSRVVPLGPGEGFAWATVEQGAGVSRGVLFERSSGRWTRTVIEGDGVDDVDLVSSPGGDAWLVTVGLDEHFGRALASVRLRRRTTEGWGPARRIEVGAPGQRFRDLSGVAPGDGLAFGWISIGTAGVEARVWIRSPERVDEPARTLSEGALAMATVVLEGRTVWLVHRARPASGSALDVFVGGDGGARPVGSIAYPFTGPFGATATRDGHLWLVGPQVDPDPLVPSVRSLALRLVWACSPPRRLDPK